MAGGVAVRGMEEEKEEEEEGFLTNTLFKSSPEQFGGHVYWDGWSCCYGNCLPIGWHVTADTCRRKRHGHCHGNSNNVTIVTVSLWLW